MSTRNERFADSMLSLETAVEGFSRGDEMGLAV